MISPEPPARAFTTRRVGRLELTLRHPIADRNLWGRFDHWRHNGHRFAVGPLVLAWLPR